MQREDGVDEAPGQHDRDQEKGEPGQRKGFGLARYFEPGEHRGDARTSTGHGEDENGKASFILKQILAVNLADAAIGDHPIGEDEVKADTDIPSEQEARHGTRLGAVQRQQQCNTDADEDGKKEPRPSHDDADRLRPAIAG